MEQHNIEAIYKTLAKIFELREDCKITITVKQKGN